MPAYLGGALASGRRILQQLTPLCVEVNKRKADLQPVEVLGNAAITHLAEPEDAFENAEGMFHMGTHPGHCAILRHFFIAERQSAVAAMMGEILCPRCGSADRLALAQVCAIAPHARFLACENAPNNDPTTRLAYRVVIVWQ